MHKQTKPSYIAYGCRYISDIKKKARKSLSSKSREQLCWGEKGEDVVRKGRTRVFELLSYSSSWPRWRLHKCCAVCFIYMCVFYYKKLFVCLWTCTSEPRLCLEILFPTLKKKKKTGLTSWRNGWFNNTTGIWHIYIANNLASLKNK